MPVRKVSRPDVAPGYRVSDLGTTGESVDLGVDLDYYTGPVFISVEHALTVGAAVGMVGEGKAKEYEDRIAHLESVVERYESSGKELISRIRSNFDQFLSGGFPVGNEAQGEAGGEGLPPTGTADRGKGSNDPKPAKSSTGERSSSVSANGSGDADSLLESFTASPGKD